MEEPEETVGEIEPSDTQAAGRMEYAEWNRSSPIWKRTDTQEDRGMPVDMDGLAIPTEWQCPVCGTERNSRGALLSSARAVSLHVAGKIRIGDGAHRQWGRQCAGDIIFDSYVQSSINNLADELETSVREENEVRRRDELARIRELATGRDAVEEPNVIAYKSIYQLETSLHGCVRQSLEHEFGEDETQWWVKGVPSQIRAECASRREEDPDREELYAYTDLVHLKKIIDRHWRLFEARLGRISDNDDSKKEFLDRLGKCNQVRNRVMHTVRMPVSSEDVLFLQASAGIVIAFAATDEP